MNTTQVRARAERIACRMMVSNLTLPAEYEAAVDKFKSTELEGVPIWRQFESLDGPELVEIWDALVEAYTSRRE